MSLTVPVQRNVRFLLRIFKEHLSADFSGFKIVGFLLKQGLFLLALSRIIVDYVKSDPFLDP